MAKNTKKVDKDYWISQVNGGINFRKKYAHEERWPTWRAYYRGMWEGDILPVNLFFTLVRTVVPRVYFRNPGISVAPAKPGLLNAAFAQILERVDNKLITTMRIKEELKKIIHNSFMFGTGCGKLGFGAAYTPSPDPAAEKVEAPLVGRRKDESIEYSYLVRPNMPWFMSVSPGALIVPDGYASWHDMPWVANEIERTLEDVKADPRFKYTDELRPTMKKMSGHHGMRTEHTVEVVKMFEIRDKKWERVIVIAQDSPDKPLYVGEDELQYGNTVPMFPLIFNEDDEVFWGIPESMILEPHQLELNEINTQMMKHRRFALVKLLIEEGAMDKTEAQKLFKEGAPSVAWTKGPPKQAIDQIQVANIPQDLVMSKQDVLQTVREQVGFGRNQFGEYYPKSRDVTATEAKIVETATAIRVDERRDMVADLMVDVFKGIHRVIFNYWDQEEVVEIVGPAGVPLWVQFKGSMLREGAYEVSVDPDTMIPQTKDMRMQKAVGTYQILKENPLIDPMKLTKYLLREMHGVQYDDLMRGMPKGTGATQQRPLNVGQYTGVLGNAQRLGLPAPGGK